MDKKKIFIGCSIAAVIFIVFLIIGGFSVYKYFISRMASMASRLEMPQDLNTPEIVKGSDLLSKNLFIQDSRLGKISDIVKGELDPSPGVEIGIAGSYGAIFINDSSQTKSRIIFSGRVALVNIIDIDSDGVCEFINRGSWGIDASLIDHKGNTVWTYGGNPGVDDMCAGDIDRDGAKEFVVGFNGRGGVHLLDKNGKKKWRQSDGNVWHVELVDTNGDGNLEIVHSNAAGQITVRDGQGKVIFQTKPAPYFSHFSLCRWPSKKDREYALLAADDTIWLFNFDGKVVAQFNAPKCGTLGRVWGQLVKIKNSQPEYLAVIVEFENWKRSILYVYAQPDVLVYQEIIPETCGSIAAISLDKSGNEAIFIGCEGNVWQYKVK